MWILSFVPDAVLIWIINAILIAGLAGTLVSFFIKFIPFVSQYKLPIQVVGIILLVAGVYLRGGYGVEMEWRMRVKEAQEKVARAEAAAKEANVKLDAALKEKNKAVKESQAAIEDKINMAEKKLDDSCKIIPEVVEILNQSAKTPEVKK